MTKAELISAVAEKIGCKKKEADAAVNAVFEIMSGSLFKSEEVSIAGFGKFVVAERAARKGRNPSTGEEIDIPAKKAATFKAAKALKETINA